MSSVITNDVDKTSGFPTVEKFQYLNKWQKRIRLDITKLQVFEIKRHYHVQEQFQFKINSY